MARVGVEICEESVSEEIIAERRLWTAVIVHAVQDWLSRSVRDKRAAQKFLFEDNDDFYRVCACAGLDPSSLRSKLVRLGRHTEAPSAPQPVTA